MPVTREYKCPQDGAIIPLRRPINEDTERVCCPEHGVPLTRYFGSSGEVRINYGFRESRYPTKVDRDIAEFQFTHL